MMQLVKLSEDLDMLLSDWIICILSSMILSLLYFYILKLEGLNCTYQSEIKNSKHFD